MINVGDIVVSVSHPDLGELKVVHIETTDSDDPIVTVSSVRSPDFLDDTELSDLLLAPKEAIA